MPDFISSLCSAIVLLVAWHHQHLLPSIAAAVAMGQGANSSTASPPRVRFFLSGFQGSFEACMLRHQKGQPSMALLESSHC